MRKRLTLPLGLAFVLAFLLAMPAWTQQNGGTEVKPPPLSSTTLPSTFDLRTLGCVTPIKQQQGGTCWTHGAMAAVESHMLVSGFWRGLGEPGHPCMSEYHLDWWNGFNMHKNDDLEEQGKTGLRVHQGGDYRVTAAYMSRGDGVVMVPRNADGKQDTRVWYKATPERHDPKYKRFYVRDIEWFTMGDNLEGIEVIKRRIMTEGALGTAYAVNGKFLSKDFVHYQPLDSKNDPNHAVAIIGWDDNKTTADKDKAAPKPGAWLIKNSWGEKRGDNGYYWISYYDKCCCRHPEMGAVSFRNIEPMGYSHIYSHDYHGWRDTLPKVSRAFNAFTATDQHLIRAVSFYTTQHNVTFTVKIYERFENGQLTGELATKSGGIAFTGLHTINLDTPLWLAKGQKFYLCVELSGGGHAIDRTSEIPVLLDGQKGGKGAKPIVLSKANPGESYYHDGQKWCDLYDYRFENPTWGTFDRTANFCLKALAVDAPAKAAPTATSK